MTEYIIKNFPVQTKRQSIFNPLNAKLNPICPLLTLLGDHHILHVSKLRVKVKSCNAFLRMLMACISIYQK